ncbi:MAG: hypothetical protein JO068_21160 [Hyphomicrobiales bacterium]|nr:hypothetical protein [Hyphomicrobiales bacterium]
MTRPSEIFAAITRNLTELLVEELARTREPDLALFIEGLEHLSGKANATSPQATPTRLPACRYLAEALDAAAIGKVGELAMHLRLLEPSLSFVQNPNYRHAPPTPSFLSEYGYAVLAGPADGAPALVSDPHLAFGVLLLGPRTEYPAHHHPATELYVPLGRADWAKGSMVAGRPEWVSREPGCVIYHPPNLVHATRTHESPLAALYLWAGDLATYARLAD